MQTSHLEKPLRLKHILRCLAPSVKPELIPLGRVSPLTPRATQPHADGHGDAPQRTRRRYGAIHNKKRHQGRNQTEAWKMNPVPDRGSTGHGERRRPWQGNRQTHTSAGLREAWLHQQQALHLPPWLRATGDRTEGHCGPPGAKGLDFKHQPHRNVTRAVTLRPRYIFNTRKSISM